MGSGRPRGRLNGVDIKPEVLRHARMRAGLSLAQVAGTELTRQAVHLIEMGKVRPSMNSLRVITSRLTVPIQSVLAQSEASRPPEGPVGELETLVRTHRYDRALRRGDEILSRSESAPVVARVQHYVGHALVRLGRPVEALQHLQLAEELFESLNEHAFVVESMLWQAKALHMSEDVHALDVAKQALERSRLLHPPRPEVESESLERLGTILAGRGDFVGARRYYEEALEAAGTVRDLGQVARIYHGLGFCYLKMGDLGRAVDLVVKAETLYEAELRISDAPPGLNLPRVESDLGVLLMEQGDLERAEQRFQSALRRYKDLGVDRLRSHALLSLGELRYRQRRHSEGLELVNEAIGIAQRNNEVRAIGEGYKQLGELRAAEGDTDAAIEAFQHALVILDEAGMEQYRLECLQAYDRAVGGRHRLDSATGA